MPSTGGRGPCRNGTAALSGGGPTDAGLGGSLPSYDHSLIPACVGAAARGSGVNLAARAARGDLREVRAEIAAFDDRAVTAHVREALVRGPRGTGVALFRGLCCKNREA